MLFNMSIGIVNSIGLYQEILDPNSDAMLAIGLDEGLCVTTVENGGFGGDWKNVGGVGYKCYFANTEQAMSVEFMEAQGNLLTQRQTLLTPEQDPSIFGSLGGLLGSFGNAVSVIAGPGGLFDIFFNSLAFPGHFMLSLWPCTDQGYYGEGVGIDKFSLDTIGRNGAKISDTPCTTVAGVDAFENIVGMFQNAMYILYIVFVIQLIANRGFRGMT